MLEKNKQTYEKAGQISISLPKIFAGVLTSLIIGGIVGAFTVVRVVDTTSFKVVAIDSELDQVQAILVPRSEYDLRKEQVDRDMQRVEDALNSIDNKLDRLLGLK